MNYLKATYFLDFESDHIQKVISDLNNNSLTTQQKAIDTYKKVRDGWRYDPYSISLAKDNYKASTIAQRNFGNCVEKSVLLVACLRGLGIPARLHLGKVKNHIAVERLTEKFGSNELTPHGMVNVQLNDAWLKCSPAFNADLCARFNVDPLEFDGVSNSFLQQYNSEGSLFMEYTEDYGHFEDVPVEFMKDNVIEHYPHIFDRDDSITEFKL
ncbi:transglutaminase-like domain-containing protein [Winogradskyella aurantiaca]|uniref:transglutaminase-like domain-containing protein n=1 Tax=Winogradskyella aurantiaca TaxID=2219558 RepID=UPI000E1D786D|nr:transglutaminase family protein [Winogradskyella aurantiaca]